MSQGADNYYYGQGKVFLAKRDANGRSGALRWVGDVSALNVNFAFDKQVSKVSRRGILLPAEQYKTAMSASITSTWHNFSTENLVLALGSIPIAEPFSINKELELPAGIVKGDIFSLPHTAVFNVTIKGLEINVDYYLDQEWGTIEFLVTPENRVFVVGYDHLKNESLPLFTAQNIEFSLHYHGVNVANDCKPVLVEIYRLILEPLAVLELINSGNNIAGMEMTAQLLADMTKGSTSEFGFFGRVKTVKSLPALTYDGQANHDGKYKYRGY